MRTRSQSKAAAGMKQSTELEVNIDFDEASQAWNANKKRVGAGYTYVCGSLLVNGKSCQCKPVRVYDTISQFGKCRRHLVQYDEKDKK